MKKTIVYMFALVFILTQTFSNAATGETNTRIDRPTKEQLVDSLIMITGIDQMVNEMIPLILKSMARTFASEFGEVDTYDKVLINSGVDEIKQHMIKVFTPAIIKAYKAAYVEHFSYDEIKQLNDFYSHGVGAKLLKSSNMIMSLGLEKTKPFMNDMMATLIHKLQIRIEAEMALMDREQP